jgi:Protein of unknown function DUF2625
MPCLCSVERRRSCASAEGVNVQPRSLNELLNRDEPAWPLVQSWIEEARNPVEVLPASEPGNGAALVATQVTTRSPMGAIIYETGGILVDHGWLRILGSGHPRLSRSLPKWNEGRAWLEFGKPPPFMLVADDVAGGFFAVDGGGLGIRSGEVCYYSPDRLIWETTGMQYSEFVHWCLHGDLAKYYENCRWPNWEKDTAALTGDQGFLIYPFLWAQGPPVAERNRGVVPISEMHELAFDFARQLPWTGEVEVSVAPRV